MSVAARNTEASEPKTDNNLDDEKKLDEEWEVVQVPIVEDKKKIGIGNGSGISSQFQLDLGWGSWRTTVFRWDMNSRTSED
jgi:hypothetical protein